MIFQSAARGESLGIRPDEYLTERYLQHNPLAASGRDNGGEVLHRSREASGDADQGQADFADHGGDGRRGLRHGADAASPPGPEDPTRSYWTTWFDTWRFVDGKADWRAHKDPARSRMRPKAGENPGVGRVRRAEKPLFPLSRSRRRAPGFPIY